MDKQTIERVARLCRLKADTALLPDLTRILEVIDHLQGVNTENVSPLTGLGASSMPVRLDAVTDGNCVEDILQNAPQSAHHMFMVPKVVE